ncbi:MAG TPA: DsbE family thiol:disulfide interchange protein [Woeseiaceae bacterium]|nr:DsbE family thiol:disulfide interchange protein [Woeseiaceae bacterium]
MKIRFLLPVVVFAVLVPFLIFGLSRNPSELPSPYIGKPAPTFSLPDLEDPERSVSSTDFAGHYTLVNVWATWCVECRAEHEFLLALSRRQSIPIYGLNWRDEREAARRWLRELGNPYEATAFDGDGRVGIDWGVYGAPETFLIGPDGRVLHKFVSPLTETVWQREFVPLIRGKEADGQDG